MEKFAGERAGEEASLRRIAAASAAGTAIEWYDFFLYGTAAGLVFGQLFFPNYSPLIGTLAAFGTFAVGFISRPLGGIFCGHFGDRIGRKAMLILTLTTMGIATFIIGLLPTYETIGIWAPILLVIMRFIQGFGIGGEWGGAVLLAVEYSPANRRGFYGSLPQIGSPIGQGLSTGLLGGAALLLTQEQFLAWGWRIPFLLSIIVVGIGLFIRLKILETPAFRQVQESHTEARLPIVDVIRAYPKELLLAIGMYLGITVTFYANTVFAISYASNQVGFSRDAVLFSIVATNIVFIFATLAFGILSDRVGRRPVYLGGALLAVVVAFPYFWLINTGQIALFIVANILLGTAVYAMFGPQAAFFAELFGTRVRYSGMSLSQTIATLIGGATAPSLLTALLAWSGGFTWPISVYIMIIGFIAALSTYLTAETFRFDIFETRPKERQVVSGSTE